MKLPQPELPFPPDVVVPGTYVEALRGMVNKEYLTSRNWQEQQHRAMREGVHSDLLVFERLLIKRMAKLGVPMFTAEAYRTPERQLQLYRDGFSKIDVGGPHPYRCAMDIVHATKAWALDKKAWALIGHVGKEIATQQGLRLEWGGDWKFYDPAHWEVAHWRDLRTVIDGKPSLTVMDAQGILDARKRAKQQLLKELRNESD